MRNAWSRLVIGGVLLAAVGCANSPTDEQVFDGSVTRSDSSGGDGTAQGADSGSPGTDSSSATDSTLGQDTSPQGDTDVLPAEDSSPGVDTAPATDSEADDSGGAADGGVDGAENDSGSTGLSGDSAVRDGEGDGGTLADSGEATDSGLARDTGESTDTGALGDAPGMDGANGMDGAQSMDGAAGADTGPVMDGGTIDSAHPTDSAIPEAGDASDGSACVVVMSGQGPFDAGTCPNPTMNSCNPANVSTFSPTYRPPSGSHQALCTTAMINQIYADCFGNGTGSCTDDENTYASCFACIFTDEGSTTWGPVVTVNNANGDIAEVNIAGCVALLEPCNQPCAQAYESAFECETQACESNCMNSSQTRYDDCTTTADNCGCQTYYDSAQCVTNITGSSHPAAMCANQTTFEGYFDAIVPLFCGM